MLDAAVGNLTAALERNSLTDTTLLIIASDNGGEARVSGNNFPLRGSKGDLFEGGIRVHALLRSSKIPKEMRGTSFGGIFHVTDWLPTILSGYLARGDVLNGVTLDGVDQWGALIGNSARKPRDNMVYNIDFDDSRIFGAVRVGDMKLMYNVQYAPVWPVQTDSIDLIDEATWWLTHDEFSSFLFNVTVIHQAVLTHF